jgi:hypothetical protein
MEGYEYLKLEKHFDLETLKELFTYNPENGELVWNERSVDLANRIGMTEVGRKSFNGKCAGRPAGSLSNNGYIQLNLQFRGFMLSGLAHRIIWIITKGKIDHQIDHIDGNRSNNKLDNLRDVPPQDNAFNGKIRENNKSGVTGVSYRKQRKCWRAYYTSDGVQYNLGHYKNIEDAIKARKDWESSSGYVFRL